MDNLLKLIDSLETKITNAFIKYKKSFKWYVIEIKFPFTSEIFIVTNDCLEDNIRLVKREKEILDYLKGRKLI